MSFVGTAKEDKRSDEWVAKLPAVVSALNNEVKRLIWKMPKDAINAKTVA